MKELNKAMVEAMKVIAPEEVKCLRKMEKERVIIHDLMIKEDVLGDYGTSSFKEVLMVIDYRIEEWYASSRDKVTEYLVNRHEEGDVVAHDEFEWACDFSAEDIAVKKCASDYEPEEPEDDDEEEFEYEWITTLPEPNHNNNNDNPFSDDGDNEYDHLDCDGTAW